MFNLDQLTRIGRPRQPIPIEKPGRYKGGDDNVRLCELLDCLEIDESVIHEIKFARAKVIMKSFKMRSKNKKVIGMQQKNTSEGFVRFTRKL